MVSFFEGFSGRNLNDVEGIRKLDKSNMLDILLNFPQQYMEASQLIPENGFPRSSNGFSNIVISGMGGSAIGGDLLRSLFINSCPIPIIVNRNYTVPAFVNENTLFIAVSFSGNTEETLSAFQAAQNRKAHIMSISSGGKLEELSKAKGFSHGHIPVQGIQPRCALGYLFVPMVTCLSKLNLIEDQGSAIKEAVELISQSASNIGPDVPVATNLIKHAAISIYNRLPFIYGSQNYLDVVALRWKSQINENSKAMAFCNAIPEMNHNEIVGWGIPQDITHRSVAIMLTDDSDSERINKRINITSELIGSERVEIITVTAQGHSPLAKVLHLIYLGDFVSYYLAFLNDVDPTPIERINILKSKLAE